MLFRSNQSELYHLLTIRTLFTYKDPAKILSSSQNTTKVENDSVTLSCIVEGRPLAEVTWWHRDTKINTNDSVRYNVSGPISVSNSQASMTINGLVRGDEGLYHCKAQNDLATVESDRAYLTVDCKLYQHYKILSIFGLVISHQLIYCQIVVQPELHCSVSDILSASRAWYLWHHVLLFFKIQPRL